MKRLKSLALSSAAFMAILALSLALSSSHGLWSSTLNVNTEFRVGDCDVRTCCFKVKIVSCWCCHKHCIPKPSVHAHLINGGRELYVDLDNFNNCSRLWIALLICNKGSLPALIKGVHVRYAGGDLELFNSLVFQSFFYGPFCCRTPRLWGLIDHCHLPFNWSLSPPMVLEPYCKAIVLIRAHSTCSESGDVNFIVGISSSLATPRF